MVNQVDVPLGMRMIGVIIILMHCLLDIILMRCLQENRAQEIESSAVSPHHLERRAQVRMRTKLENLLYSPACPVQGFKLVIVLVLVLIVLILIL